MSHIELLFSSEFERIDHHPPADRINKQGCHAGHSSQHEFPELRRRPACTLDPPPSPFDESSSSDDAKHDQPDQPGTMRIDPYAKQRRKEPQRTSSRGAEAFQNNQ